MLRTCQHRARHARRRCSSFPDCRSRHWQARL